MTEPEPGAVICLVLLFLLGVATSDASYILRTQFAFQSPYSVVAARTKSNIYHLCAVPGMSDERRKQEREAEIRSTIAKLKREGKMKSKGSATGGSLSEEDSAMLEAEAFFNRASPVRKFEEKVAERRRIASMLEEAANEKKEQGDDSVK